ncbi:MAG: hypothetical protein Q8L79_03315 [Methylobacter sp.]|uniref:hypothetical protein n=1 Tax=Methylobacter sp. TaxID=2051955 RepID=UPI0027302BAA|nr:hypothetical protein [Methylobacter sp.]MDP1664131.1 hypothetical protein [Methylobacter sp.]
MTAKKDKPAGSVTTEQPTNRESTADAPEASALAEANQSADGVEAKAANTKALDQDKTPLMGDSSLEQEKAAGDENTPARDAGSDSENVTALIAMRRDLADDGPATADVHPDEVKNWLVHGWEIDPLADGFEIHDPNS